MELFCVEVMVSNGNFEILSPNFSFMPRYTFSKFSQIACDTHLKSEFLPQQVYARFPEKKTICQQNSRPGTMH